MITAEFLPLRLHSADHAPARHWRRRALLCLLTVCCAALLTVAPLTVRPPFLPALAAGSAAKPLHTAAVRHRALTTRRGFQQQPAAADGGSDKPETVEILTASAAAAADGAMLSAAQFRSRQLAAATDAGEPLPEVTSSTAGASADEQQARFDLSINAAAAGSVAALPEDWRDDGDIAAGATQTDQTALLPETAAGHSLQASPAEQQHAAEAIMLAAAMDAAIMTISADAAVAEQIAGADPATQSAVNSQLAPVGQLAACIAASADGAGGPFRLQDFVAGKPPRLTPVLELISAKLPAFDATAISVFSLDRLDRLDGLCASWGGPLSAAVYFPIVDRSRPLPPLAADDAWMDALQAQWEAEDASAEDLPLAASGPEAAEAAAAAEALASARQAVQAAFNRADAADGGCQLTLSLHMEPVADTTAAQIFPANALRNAALLHARTQLVLVVGGDMLISPALSAQLAVPAEFAKMQTLARARYAVVLPAFQAANAASDTESLVLGSKAQLTAALLSKAAFPFPSECAACHRAIDVGRWLAAPLDVLPYAINFTKGLDAHVLASRALLPPFDARFRGYGLDKASWTRLLHGSGFRFAVHPGAFLLHRPHEPSPAQAAWASSQKTRKLSVAAATPLQAISGTAYALAGSMEWHLQRGSYQPVTGAGFPSCRSALPWWRVFPASGGAAAVADFAHFKS